MRNLVRMRRLVFALCLAALFAVSACNRGQAPSRWNAAQQTSVAGQGNQPAGQIVPGSSFNRLFPRSAAQAEGLDFTFTQEKAGFAEASLSRDGQPAALLSISDTTANPSATEKYRSSTRTIAGYPAYQDENVTAVLVADRFQVQIFSESDSFTASDRETWLQKFDFGGLAALK